ncbi:MAG: RidA family protein [Thermoplasmata archaeon]|nr:MAG: RidA family protein [Thermoplasmata archaeon]
MSKEIVSTEDAPAAIGPYSQAVVANGFVYASGQIGIIPATGRLVEGDIAAEARQALDNIEAVLKAGGSSLQKAVKVTVYLTDVNDFADVNAVYMKYFSETPPARACVGVAALPLNARVEIEAVAVQD